MKRSRFLLIFLLIVPGVLRAQQDRYADTTRLLELGEVDVTTKRQSIKEQLLQLFRANQSSTLEEILSRLPEI